jgi:hypothetical protein
MLLVVAKRFLRKMTQKVGGLVFLTPPLAPVDKLISIVVFGLQRVEQSP